MEKAGNHGSYGQSFLSSQKSCAVFCPCIAMVNRSSEVHPLDSLFSHLLRSIVPSRLSLSCMERPFIAEALVYPMHGTK